MEFNHWYNEVADIPEKDENGNWVDLETGIPFSSKSATVRKIVSEDVKEIRSDIKKLGGKILTGSMKQKEWAEKIRFKKIYAGHLSAEGLKDIVNVGGFTNSAKFWIENRNVDSSEFIAENIVGQYTGLQEVEAKNHRELAVGGQVSQVKNAVKEVKDYLKSCSFNFKSNYDRVNNEKD